jgi:hypothetical protein
MSDAFDPYFKWLGIPKPDQPPHAYRLLGIELFESDADVISNAADGRMAQIKSYQTGKFGAVSQKLLNEIAAAKICLLKLEKKAEYDRRLRAHLQKKAAPVQVAQVQSSPLAQAVAAPALNDAGLSFLDEYATAATRSTTRTATKAKKSAWLVPAVIGVFAFALAGGAVGFYIYADGGRDQLNHSQASLPGDSHYAAQPSGSAIAPVKPAGSGEIGPKSSGNVPVEASDSGHAPAAKPSAAPAAPDTDTELKPKADVTPGPETPNPEETAPKGNPDKGTVNPVPDQTPKEDTPVKKSPMPDQAQFQAMKGKILKIFQKEFADAKTAQAKLALAAKLDGEADASKGDPAERFALWRMAADKAAEAGDVSAAVDIIDKIDAQFDGDIEAIKYELLSAGAARATSTPEGARNLCETAMKLAAAAVAREDYDAASRYAKLATGSLRRVKDPQFSREVVVHDREIERLKTRYSAVAKAMETLKKEPDNAAANLTVGQWRCFVRDDWEKGLPYLAKGSREDLAQLARQELAKPAVAAEQAAVGDGWWALAEKDRTEAKAGFRARALYWYEQASPGLSGLEKVRVDKQIETLAQASGGEPRPATPATKTFGVRGVVQNGNVALLSYGASVSGVKTFPEKMINPADTNPTSYGPTPCEFIVTLDKVYQLQQIRFKLQDKTTAAYQVFVSRDGSKFELLQDCRNQRMAGWQNLPFAARPVKSIKLTCHGPDANFCIDSLEAYCYPTSADGSQQPRTRRGGN